jgi:hypothetical protein
MYAQKQRFWQHFLKTRKSHAWKQRILGCAKENLEGQSKYKNLRKGYFHSWIRHNRSVSIKQAEFFQTNESDTQRVGVAFTYRFGKDTFARKRRHNDNAADDEKGRVN